MKYFTAEEAKRIIKLESLSLCTAYDDNPNREAFNECIKCAKEFNGSSITVAAASGFLLGRATGIREERARRKA